MPYAKQIQKCDCGKRAYKRDGSGWFCVDCEIATANAGKIVTKAIYAERGYEFAAKQQETRKLNQEARR